MGDVIDRLHHGVANLVFGQVFDEHAIYLEIVHLEIFQIGKGRNPPTEVIQRKTTPPVTQSGNEALRNQQIRCRYGLGNLETETLRRHAAGMQALDHETEKRLIVQ